MGPHSVNSEKNSVQTNQVIISTRWKEGSIWVGSSPLYVLDYSFLSNVSSQLVIRLQNIIQNRTKEFKKMHQELDSKCEQIKELQEKYRKLQLQLRSKDPSADQTSLSNSKDPSFPILSSEARSETGLTQLAKDVLC